MIHLRCGLQQACQSDAALIQSLNPKPSLAAGVRITFIIELTPITFVIDNHHQVPNSSITPSTITNMSSTALKLPSSRSCTLYTPLSGTTPVAPASGDRKVVKSSEITLTTKDGQPIKAYLAVPVMDTPPSTGVVYVSDIFGCDNPVNREIADLFASYSIPISKLCLLRPRRLDCVYCSQILYR